LWCHSIQTSRIQSNDGDTGIGRLENLEVTHVDETWAARSLNVRWTPEQAAAQAEEAR
jgi:hypothetical protein